MRRIVVLAGLLAVSITLMWWSPVAGSAVIVIAGHALFWAMVASAAFIVSWRIIGSVVTGRIVNQWTGVDIK